MSTMTPPAPPGFPDPRNVFLTAKEVIARYNWGRTYGYQMLASTGFPKAIGGRYRLDRLMAWEDRVLDGQLPGQPDPRTAACKATPASAAESATPHDEPAQHSGVDDVVADCLPVQAPTRRRTRGTRRAA